MNRILVVEDARFYRIIICQKLNESMDCEVNAVESLREAELLLNSKPSDYFSVAILDLVLPDAAHGEIIDLIAAHSIPIVVFAGSFTEDLRETMLEKNVFDYFIKSHPGTLDSVVVSVQRILRNTEVQIMVVDDSRFSRSMIRTMLQTYRFNVVEAEDGIEALDMLKKHPDIQLVVTDYAMPRMDGFELISHIRRDYDRYTLAVIGISAQINPIDSVKFLKNGANDFLPKPFLKEELYNRVLMNLETLEQMRREKERTQKLKELNDIKNKFLGMAAHDLRNPLSGIRGLSQFMREESEDLSEEHREFVNAIYDASTHMLTMVNELLDVAVIESGQLDLHLESGSITDLVSDRLRFNRALADKKNIVFDLDLKDVPAVSFDSSKLTQVVDNLITNAIKFSPAKSHILISCEEHNHMVVVTVKDHGPGLSEADQEKLFGAFQKLSAKPTAGESSTGLGLSIARKIVEAHQGRIWADSSRDDGATFHFSLPSAT